MDEDAIQDLKQFITTTVQQEAATVKSRLDKVDVRLEQVGVKIDDTASFVAEVFDNTNEATDVRLKDHSSRIARLEQKAA